MSEPLIVIGNKRYSSWSLRGWIVLRKFAVSFREHRINLDKKDTHSEILRYSSAGRVPVLIDGDLRVHDSLAIMEYANEAYAGGGLLPEAPQRRALARSVCAEMHAGFPNLRGKMPMNLGRSTAQVAVDSETAAEIGRILTMWEELRQAHREEGQYLFGGWSMADCMYLPVAARFQTYAVDLSAHSLAGEYTRHLLEMPEFLEWRDAALEETELLAEYESI